MTIENVPDILDVNNLISLLIKMGVSVSRSGEGRYSFKADNVDMDYLESVDFLKSC